MYDAWVIRGRGHRAAGVGCRAVALKPGGGRKQAGVEVKAEELLSRAIKLEPRLLCAWNALGSSSTLVNFIAIASATRGPTRSRVSNHSVS